MFSNIFEGKFKDLEKYFSIYLEKNNSNDFLIGLEPKHSKMKKSLSNIILHCKDDVIKELEVNEANGDNNKIKFKDMVFDSNEMPEHLQAIF